VFRDVKYWAIADSNASALSAENDHITNLTGPLIYTSLLEIVQGVVFHRC
jgi:hypothetical protein